MFQLSDVRTCSIFPFSIQLFSYLKYLIIKKWKMAKRKETNELTSASGGGLEIKLVKLGSLW